jgi:hypothetical protein
MFGEFLVVVLCFAQGITRNLLEMRWLCLWPDASKEKAFSPNCGVVTVPCGMPRQHLWVENLPGYLSTEINRFQPLPCLSNLLELPKPLLWGVHNTVQQIRFWPILSGRKGLRRLLFPAKMENVHLDLGGMVVTTQSSGEIDMSVKTRI